MPYYERFGFKVTGETDARQRTTAPTIWFMWRDPQAPEA